MATILENIQELQSRIRACCVAHGRAEGSVKLLAVSKTFGADAVREAHAAGLSRFGENYVQESIEKITTLAELRNQLEWHMIGPLQSNKTRPVAEHFDWVHSVDRLKIAQRLSEQRPDHLPPLQICLQVNISNEASKSGLRPEEVQEVALQVARLPKLQLRGLMSIPEPASDLPSQRAPHRALATLLRQIQQHWPQDLPPLDTLSMGMSADLEAAIAEGATIVRIGSSIFGQRLRPAGP